MNSDDGIEAQDGSWESIVSAHGLRVYRVAQRILGSVQDAEDVSQEVFLEAFRVFQKDPIQSWVGLLVRLATLRSLDFRRRRRIDAQLSDQDCVLQFDPAGPLIKAELAQRLRDAVGQLPVQQATVFVMTFYEQMSRSEIAKTLGISQEAVSTSLFKARQRLSKIMSLSQEESRR